MRAETGVTGEMLVTVQLFPPLAFPNGEMARELELGEGACVGRLLEYLDRMGALGSYGVSGVFALVGSRVAAAGDILQPAQVVKVLMLPLGG